MDTRKELVVTDLAQVFEPKTNLSDIGRIDKWRKVPYEAVGFSGVALTNLGNGKAGDITYDPGLTGWYKIYIQAPGVASFKLQLKLTSDPAFTDYSIQLKGATYIDDNLWRCADMTGEAITITRRKNPGTHNSAISGLRFVPMSEEEVALYKYEATRKDTKRLYATDDMHNRPYCFNLEDYSDWLSAVLPFKDSDVEWLSLEEIRVFATGKCPCDPDEYAFEREGDRRVQKQMAKFDYDKVLANCVKLGQDIGLKMSISLRMGAWGMGFPHDQCYFDCDYYTEHPELHCVDRNGDEISAMSYAFPETRKFMVDVLVNMARSGCDAVTLIAHRGIPYVLFEKPVVDKYYETYGEYPYDLPIDNPRINKIHCDIMTGFFREVREALDKEFGKGKVRIQLRSLDSIRHTLNTGIDAEELARLGLVDDIIVFPQAFEEVFNRVEGVLYDDEEKGEKRINMDMYDEYVHGPFETLRRVYTDKCSLEELTANVSGWLPLEEKYGVKLYFEIMPRFMPNEEYKRRALELYSLGAERFALWDTYGRVICKGNWNMIGKLGHKDELESIDPAQFERKAYKVQKYCNTNVSRYKPAWGG